MPLTYTVACTRSPADRWAGAPVDMPGWLTTLLGVLALPEYGLSTLFVAAFVSATLIPVGSEPALYGLLLLNPDLFWSAVFVATAGNTLGGAVDW